MNVGLNMLLPGYQLIFSIIVSFLIWCGTSQVEKKRKDKDQTYCEIIYDWMFGSFNPTYAPDVFLCKLSKKYMTDPAVLHNTFYEYTEICTYVKQNGKDPFGTAATVNDIHKHGEMKSLCYRFKYDK